MSTEQLNKWLALVANLGVIVGILFLVVEIRQSNQIAIASNEILIRQTYGSATESVIGSPQLIELLSKAEDPDADLTAAERTLGIFYIAREFNTWGAVDKAYANGMVSLDSLNGAKDDIRVMFRSYPALRFAFQDMVDGYPSNSSSEIYRTVSELLDDE